MRCISMWQPHATLFAIGARNIETRGEWAQRITYRGPLLIHAAKKWDEEMAEDYRSVGEFLSKIGYAQDVTPKQMSIYAMKVEDTLGKILAIGELHDIRPIPDVPTLGYDRYFGLFGPGRVGLFIRDIKPIVPPIPFRGAQQLFDVPDELVKEHV